MPDITSLPLSEAPPVLSTPDTRLFEESIVDASAQTVPTSDVELAQVYEIDRTAREIIDCQWKRIALQFPDPLLIDAPRVSKALSRRVFTYQESQNKLETGQYPRDPQVSEAQGLPSDGRGSAEHATTPASSDLEKVKIFILADTSYGACCVDEVAAEHGDADAVVHYGRACLSPTARLPVIYCYTKQPLSQDAAVQAFCGKHRDLEENVMLMADLPYQHCLQELSQKLRERGYCNLFVTSVIEDARSPLPNRTTPPTDVDGSLLDWSLFHVSEPTPSLLLTLASRVQSVTFFPTATTATAATPQTALEAATSIALRRRYALLTSLSTIPIFGILINTLSVRNYMQILSHVKSMIAAAGKKSYTFVVGKVNAAKIANFSEVGGWVVIGCWESSLFEAKDFWKPIITPFELELTLQRDDERVWSGRWSSNFQEVLDNPAVRGTPSATRLLSDNNGDEADAEYDYGQPRQSYDASSDEDSSPPAFDLRTGRYVSHSRPLDRQRRSDVVGANTADESESQALTRRPRGDLATIVQASPAAQFLNEQRTWQGLGSDFERSGINGVSEGATVEQGRHGIARGYRVGQDSTRDDPR